MDIPSNVCIACSCRSTRPFHTFLVSIIGQLWLGSTKHVPVPEPQYRTPLSLPRTGIEMGLSPLLGIMLSPTHAYLPRVRVKCGIRVATSALVYQILHCLFHHTYILGIPIPVPILYYPQIVIQLSFLFSQPRGVVKTPYYTKGEISTSNWFSPVSYLSTLTLPIPSPVYGIISLCPMYRIQVASNSADNQLVFNRFTNSSDRASEIQQLIENF